MSRKHAHRADNAPASRRYVRSVVQHARDEIISAIMHSRPVPAEPGVSWQTTMMSDNLSRTVGPDLVQARLDRYVARKDDA